MHKFTILYFVLQVIGKRDDEMKSIVQIMVKVRLFIRNTVLEGITRDL